MKLFKHIFCLLACMAAAVALQAQTNRLVIPDLEAASGKTVQIPVELENTSDIIGLQFDLTLPDGITAESNDVTLTTRSANHTVTARNNGSKLRILVFSPDNTPLRGNAGALLYINASIPGELEQGSEHQLVISDPMLSDTGSTEALTSYQAGRITITPSADLVPRNISVNPTSAAPGDTITVSWNVENIGSLPTTGGWREQVYVLKGDSRCLIGTVYNQDPLAAGAIMARNVTVALPEEIGVDGPADVRVKLMPNSDCGEPVSAQGNNTLDAADLITLGKHLVLTVPASRPENGSSTVRCTLTRTGNKRAEQTFRIDVSGTGDAGRISAPATVLIKYGNSSAYFDLTITDDHVVNTNGDYVITASGNGYDPADAPITIVDDEKPQLTLLLPEDPVIEGETFTATVNCDYAPIEAVALGVYCDKTSRFSYPAKIVLPAGETSVNFQIKATQNDQIQGDTDATFVVSAEGYLRGEDMVQLKDDDIPVIELTVTPTTVNENAGYLAMEASLRRISNLGTRATIKLSDNLPGVLRYNNTIVLEKGVQGAEFSIGVIDDANVNGERNIRLTAAVYLSACSCNAGSESGGEVSVDITVLDDDGQALSLAVDRGTWLEGGSGILTLSHNTIGGLDTDLTVNISSDYDSMLEYDHSVVIPAHRTQVEIPVTIKQNGVAGDNANVTFTAQSDGFTKAVMWVQVSDQTIPDGLVTEVMLPTEPVYAGGEALLRARVANTGYAPLPDGTKVVFYKSEGSSRTTFGTTYLTAAIAPGESDVVTLSGVVVSDRVQQLNISAEVNSDKTVPELSYTNNRSPEESLDILSPISLTVDELDATYPIGSEIVISGAVSSIVPGGDVADVDVDVYVINDGYRQVLPVKSDASGRFEVSYTPAAGQIGIFTVGACYPNQSASEAMRQFDIIALKRTSNAHITTELSTNEPQRILIPIKNPTSIDFHNLTMRSVSLPDGVSVTVTPVSLLKSGETAKLEVVITSTTSSPAVEWYPAEIAIDNDEGSPLAITIYEYTRKNYAALQAGESSIRTTMNIHSSRTYPLTITNTGRAATGKISVVLPSWMKSETPISLPSMEAGESTDIILRFQPNETMVANVPISGQLAVNCENGTGVTIPYNITPVSELNGNLRVNVCDEYTYYSADKPMVKNATVQLRNAYTNSIVDEMFTGEVGFVLFSDIPEGYYTVTVSAPNHDSYRDNIILSPGETTVLDALITFQAITVEWEVEETEVEDEYEIITTVRYETSVPKPVLILTAPKKYTLTDYANNSRNLFYLSVTNEGLITANDVELSLPDDTYTDKNADGSEIRAHFEWQAVPEKFDLAPKQTRTVPFYLVVGDFADDVEEVEVEGQTLAPGRRNASSRNSSNCIASLDAIATYPCGPTNQYIMGYTVASLGSCYGSGGIVYVPTVGTGGGSGSLGSPSGSGGTSSGGATEQMAVVSKNVNFCNSCAQQALNALTPCMIGFSPAGCPAGVYDAVNNFDPYKWQSYAGAALSVAGCVAKDPLLGTAINAASCLLPLTEPCGNEDESSEASVYRIPTADGGIMEVSEAEYAEVADFVYHSAAKGPRRASSLQGNGTIEFLQNAAGVAIKIWSSLAGIYTEQFGSLSGGWGEMSLKECAALYSSLLTLPEGQEFDHEEWASVKPAKISTEEFNLFLDRLNNTMRHDAGLDYDPTNFIDHTKALAHAQALSEANQELRDGGFSDADELFTSVTAAWDAFQEKNKNSVCASVVIQFEQTLVMTRQAFRGTLTVTNGHETKPMTDVKLAIQIKDDTGNVASSHEFQVNPERLNGFEGELALDAGWTLAANGKGIATIMFIPTRYAAPDCDKVYYFGGTLTYIDPFNDTEVTRELAPVAMTVRPSAVLSLDYFMQRTLFGDNPLTKDVIEPIIPGEFSLIINNIGLGDATNVRMTTKQPKIIENEKGLYIDFEIIGATLNGKESSSAFGESIITPFGTIPAGRTAYAQWWLTSSLLGHFTEYDVNYTHLTSYDNPDLSLLEEVNIHPLIHTVRLDDSLDRPEFGFLADDFFDDNATPDHIYMSTGIVADVMEMESAAITPNASPVDGQILEYRLTATPKFSGWAYGNLTDPTMGKQDVERIVRVRDSKELPAQNFWQTSYTMVDGDDPINEYKLHFADDMTIAGEQYIITFSPKPDVELEVAAFGNVPAEGEYPESQVEYITVTFNKTIDPATFTTDDVTFTVEGVKQSAELFSIEPVGDDTQFRIRLDNSFAGRNGFYSIAVQTAQITDNEGFNGSTGKECHWVYLTNAKFNVTLVAPAGYTFQAQAYAPKIVDGDYQYYGAVHTPEYMIYDTTPVAVKDSYSPVELMYPLHLTFDIVPDSPEVAELHRNEKVRYYMSNINSNGVASTEAIEPVTSAIRAEHGDYPWSYYQLVSGIDDVVFEARFEKDYNNCVYISTDNSNLTAANIISGVVDNPELGLYETGSQIEISATVPEGYSVKWYRVITTRKDAGSALGFVPGELQFITSEPSFSYAVTGKSFKTLQEQYAANPDYQMADGEYNWIVCSVFCHRTQDERVFRKGWNYVSFNDRSLDLTSFMTSCGSALTGIRGDNGIYMFDSTTGWTGTPVELSVGKSYDVYFSRECTYRRLNAILPVVEETDIVLTTGWSRIGYTPDDEMSVGEALKDYTPSQNDVIKDYDGFAIYDDGAWKGTMRSMAPGVGYKYYTTSPDSFTYNADGGGASARRRVFSYLDPQAAKGEYPDNMTVIAEVRSHLDVVQPQSAALKVLAFVDDECRGVGEYVDNTHVFITIYGTEAGATLSPMHRAPLDPEQVRYEVVTDEIMIYPISGTADFTLVPQGTYASPVVLSMPEHPVTGVTDARTDVKMYSARPNPVHDTLYLIGLTDRIHGWMLYDMAGAVMATGKEYNDAEGIDVSRLSNGQYILMLDTDFGPQSVKIIKN